MASEKYIDGRFHRSCGNRFFITHASIIIGSIILIAILNCNSSQSQQNDCLVELSSVTNSCQPGNCGGPNVSGGVTLSSSKSTICDVGRPCDDYRDEVDLRVIVLTQSRPLSLRKLLRSLDRLELDGDRAALEIWIDRSRRSDDVDHRTIAVARSFRWARGPTRVHVQRHHVGIYGQWIDSWRPRVESSEIGLILEDDISVSPFAYRWLKAVHRKYSTRPDYVGATLNTDQMSILSLNRTGVLAAPKNDTVLMYKCLGTWGFSPKVGHWRNFQVSVSRLLLSRRHRVEVENYFH